MSTEIGLTRLNWCQLPMGLLENMKTEISCLENVLQTIHLESCLRGVKTYGTVSAFMNGSAVLRSVLNNFSCPVSRISIRTCRMPSFRISDGVRNFLQVLQRFTSLSNFPSEKVSYSLSIICQNANECYNCFCLFCLNGNCK